jgi:starch phosphorylase
MALGHTPIASSRLVAYFSMEVALDPRMPTYAGGLGVLAGDMLRAAVDQGMPFVGVSLLHREGYFDQRLSESGEQHEAPVTWRPDEHLEELPPRVAIEIEGRVVQVRAWRYLVHGHGGRNVPVYLLDTQLPQNHPEDRAITNQLYGGDQRNRLRQSAILGIGGALMLDALGYDDIGVYHLNEGHSAPLVLELWRRELRGRPLRDLDADVIARARSRCVFTTHTPVPDGHDRFPWPLVARVLGDEAATALRTIESPETDVLNMTHLALAGARSVNAVAMRHGDVSRAMFPGYAIHSITNGVHAGTWVTDPFQALFDQHVPGWRDQNSNLRYAGAIPLPEIARAHGEAKHTMLAAVSERVGRALADGVFTIGFARRATGYKQADLIFADLERLRGIARTAGPMQLIFAGKAHPEDETGKGIIRRIFDSAAALGDDVAVVYLDNYEIEIARLLCGGCDLWLNTPRRPHEASGTSGMKAALNGVPSLSVLDGWWIEGHHEGVTGWAIGESWQEPGDAASDAASLYDKLEHAVLPAFYGPPEAYQQVMRSAIALNGSFFTAERMLLQYAERAYRDDEGGRPPD